MFGSFLLELNARDMCPYLSINWGIAFQNIDY